MSFWGTREKGIVARFTDTVCRFGILERVFRTLAFSAPRANVHHERPRRLGNRAHRLFVDSPRGNNNVDETPPERIGFGKRRGISEPEAEVTNDRNVA